MSYQWLFLVSFLLIFWALPFEGPNPFFQENLLNDDLYYFFCPIVLILFFSYFRYGIRTSQTHSQLPIAELAVLWGIQAPGLSPLERPLLILWPDIALSHSCSGHCLIFLHCIWHHAMCPWPPVVHYQIGTWFSFMALAAMPKQGTVQSVIFAEGKTLPSQLAHLCVPCHHPPKATSIFPRTPICSDLLTWLPVFLLITWLSFLHPARFF